MNILITSAGRRTYIVDYFKKALDGKGLVFASNSKPSPALTRADAGFLTPPIYDDSYIPFLLAKCSEHKIGLLVSLFDIDLPVLAAHREDFAAAGTVLAVSDSGMLAVCNDKYAMHEFLTDLSIDVPDTFISLETALEALENRAQAVQCGTAGSIKNTESNKSSESAKNTESTKDSESTGMHFPVIVKPRFGMGSIGVLKAGTPDELRGAYSMCRRDVTQSYLRYESRLAETANEAVMIQASVPGYEYGLDVICDLDGNYINTIIRKKLGMRSGETDEAVILGEGDAAFDVLERLGKRLARALKPKGLIDVDIIMADSDLRPWVIDINARFGGGYPFSHIAGADVPRAYVYWAVAKQADMPGTVSPAARQAGMPGADSKRLSIQENAGDKALSAADIFKLCSAKKGVHGFKDIAPTVVIDAF